MTTSASSHRGKVLVDSSVAIMRVGIIGGGVAGLATARAFLRANMKEGDGGQGVRRLFEVTVLEARDTIGGIWNYDANDASAGGKLGRRPKCRPMYRNLRTNLPRELMAFKEFPWGGDGEGPSYVTHSQVQRYLEDYANKFDLIKCIQFGCVVTDLKVLKVNDENDHDIMAVKEEKKGETDPWPKISLEWTDQKNDLSFHKIFDAVCICNGHYALPSCPQITGLERFSGKVMHSIMYDDPNDFVGLTVLCIGARASGVDIAREIGLVAKCVYLSDSSCERREEYGTIIRMPRTRSVGMTGEVMFSNESNDEWSANDIDVILLCSGYDYSFPFITEESNLELTATVGERRVQPLYEQLWHAHHPSLSFIGLPLQVVPFPFCEIQAEAVVSQWTMQAGSIPLPSFSERIAAAKRDAISGGPKKGGRVLDTHELGSAQWNYCRKLAKIAGMYDNAMESYIATNTAIYDRSRKERNGTAPGGRDLYRETRFRRQDKEHSFEILFSEIDFSNSAVL